MRYSNRSPEKSVQDMYNENDLEKLELFQGGYINWGLYDQLNQIKISKKDREKASMRLYEKCLSLLEVKPIDKVLEVGFGKGTGLKYIQNYFHLEEIYGVDQSPLYYELCQKALPNANLYCMNVESSFPSSHKFDTIISIEMAQHIENIEGFISRAYEALNYGGTLLISTFFGLLDNAQEILADTIQTVNAGVDFAHPINKVKRYLGQLGCGFTIESIGSKVFPGYDQWISQTHFVNSWGRYWYKHYQNGVIDYFIIKVLK